MGKRISKRQLIAAFRNSGGLVTFAADSLGITRQAIYKRMSDDPSGEIKQALDEIRDQELDVAEYHLRKNIRNGSSADIRFFLETLGKDRGYVKRTETTGADGGAIKLDLTGMTDADLDRLSTSITKGGS